MASPLEWTTAEPPIVALVCSAGGLDALAAVLSRLPGDFPGAVVVLQHQAPERKSRLAPILATRCRLPVHVAEDGTQLRPGEVVVVPPGKHALLTVENRVALIDSDGTPPYRPSADLLLTSLALVAARRTIAVILSGGGHDGATGATAIHEFGGIVLASDKESSQHFAMPEAAIARDDVVDYVLRVDDIADCLASLLDADARID
jgi:two-component system chemotaxis response regulator CheB